jgi:hypothetical protein
MRRQRIDGDCEQNGGGGKHKMGKNGEKSYKTGENVASSLKLLYLWILYRCIASSRFIARKICLYRQKCRFIAQNLTNFIASSVQENCCLVFFYRFIGDKNFGEQNCIALFDFFLKNCVSVSL